MEWLFRPMVVEDLPDLLIVQERGAVAGLARVVPQETHPFPRQAIQDRWRDELADLAIASYVATDTWGTSRASQPGAQMSYCTSGQQWRRGGAG